MPKQGDGATTSKIQPNANTSSETPTPNIGTGFVRLEDISDEDAASLDYADGQSDTPAPNDAHTSNGAKARPEVYAQPSAGIYANPQIDNQAHSVTTAPGAHASTPRQPSAMVSGFALSIDDNLYRTRSGAIRKVTAKKRTRTSVASKVKALPTTSDKQVSRKPAAMPAPLPQQTALLTANNENFDANISAQLAGMRIHPTAAKLSTTPHVASNLSFVPVASSSSLFELQPNYSSNNNLGATLYQFSNNAATHSSAAATTEQRPQPNAGVSANFLNGSAVTAAEQLPQPNTVVSANLLNSSAATAAVQRPQPNAVVSTNFPNCTAAYTTATTSNFLNAGVGPSNVLSPPVTAVHNNMPGNVNFLNQSAVSSANFAPMQGPRTGIFSSSTIPPIYAQAPQISTVPIGFPYSVPHNYSLNTFSYANTQPSLSQYQPMTSSIPMFTLNNSIATAPPINSQRSFMQNSAADYTLSTTHVAARHAISKDLPFFNGRPEEWPIFITNYVQSTERCGFTDQENLIRLQKCLKGPALEAVRGKLMMPATVPFAIETLRMLYGRPEIIHHALQRKLKEEQPIRKDKLETLINFALAVQNYRATMEAIGLADYLNDPMLLNELLEKLPCDLKLDWGRHRIAFARVDIVLFDSWLFNLATCATQVTSYVPPTITHTNEEVKSNRKQSKERIFVHDVIDSTENVAAKAIVCPKCTKPHRLAECTDFTSLKTNDRWKFIREQKLCLRCFRKHYLRRCNYKRQCGVDGCKMPHNPLLHSTRTQDQASGGKESNVSSTQIETILTRNANDNQSVLFHAKQKKKTLFRYIPVTLFGNNRSLNTFALIDEGAACTLVENEIANALGLEGPTEELCLQWTGDITQREENSRMVTLQIASQENNARKFCLRNVRTVSALDLPEQTLDKSEIYSCVDFEKVPIRPYVSAKARILIGLDNADICVPLEVKESSVDGLIAAKCRIGWSVYGHQCGTSSEPLRLMHICPCNTNDRMDDLLKNYFSLEAIGINTTGSRLRSKEDERAIQIMEATTKYIESEKVWETGLLWKYDKISLPDSLPMARRRLQCLEIKMARSPELKTFLIEKFNDYEKKGYVRKLQKEEIVSGGKSWYIPTFTVTNKNKNKTRIVWDAAAAVNGVSLNSALMKGPDLLKSLVGILIRFREMPVALSGDIREMFHQVRVAKDDQISQKFLWRNGDISKTIDVYVMTVMTFGASCSPSLANYVKNKNAERFREIHPRAVDAIIENTFVDDWLQSIDTEEQLIEMAKIVRAIHKDGGFEMRNWLSNSKSVLNALEQQPEQDNKCIQDPGGQHEKVLGMWWLPQSDILTFMQKFSEEVFDEMIIVTKRKILRVVMSIFDPLGLLGFFVIYAKILLQEIWRSRVTWDEPIGADEQDKWWLWVKLLPAISNVRIPRCYGFLSSCANVQMHVFVDASINAYAALVYLRAEEGEIIKCSLVASKTRVAPLKPVSIPKLELLAAVLGLRLANFVGSELSLRISRRVFWSDSKNVLYWIRSDARKYQQFVALRIGEILESSQVKEWRWVSSAENVADDGTKWAGHPQFDANSRWFTGPGFLNDDESKWPVMDFNNNKITEPESMYYIECKQKIVSMLDAIVPDPTRFSKWEIFRNAQWNVLKFLRLIRKKPFTTKHSEALINISDVDSVENVIMRKCQEEVYSDEIKLLQSGKAVSRTSEIYKCSPYMDEFGVLRMKGRIDAIDGVAISVKRPIILPSKHPVSYLLADFYHRKYHHHHDEVVVNEMRQRFRISGLRALVNATSKKCQFCKNRRAKPSCPEMGDVPPERLAAFTRPFHFTGVDYFGPLEIVIGRRREKRWGVLFTCMTMRAVHIEIAPSLSTDSFLLAFKQFISRRGVPHRVLSDNATNFRGASRVLLSEVEKISSDELEREYPRIEWKFIPAASPHMGGSWERMVRSVKSVLMDILPEDGLREEVLRAALADVENIINSRPLTYVPLETSESEALTPNHLLLGCSSGVRERAVPDSSGVALSKNFRISGALADQFWKRWLREYLPCLTRRVKWHENVADPIAVGDVVIVVDENAKRNNWQKGVIIDVHRAKDSQIRSAVVKTTKGLITRPSVKLAKLDVK